MFRLLFWAALIAAAFWLWRRFTRPARPARSTHEAEAEPMVRCQHCHVHLPRDKAIAQDGNWYCSQAHLEQDRGQR